MTTSCGYTTWTRLRPGRPRVFSGNTLATFYLQVFGHGFNTVPVTLVGFYRKAVGKNKPAELEYAAGASTRAILP
jgi:hypothetical protein